MTYAVTTRWTDEDGETFDRTHTWRAPSVGRALAFEEEHNRTREPTMAPDGWTWEIVGWAEIGDGTPSTRKLGVA